MTHLPTRLTAVIALFPVFLTQCATTQVRMDENQLREVMMDYCENQIVDNVIRARNSMPILHCDMEHVDALVKTNLSGSIGGGRTETSTMNRSRDINSSFSRYNNASQYSDYTNSSVGGSLGILAGIGSTITKPFSWAASGSRDNTLDVRMVPVMDENAVYAAYEKFVSINKGDSVRDSLHFPIPDIKQPHPDDPDGVHVGRKWRGVYYWVPNKYRKEFFKLCIAAGVTRDARTAARIREDSGSKLAGEELRRMRLY